MPTQEEISILEQRWSSCKYKPEFDRLLKDHLSKGLSFMSFNVVGGVAYKTLVTWTKRFPSFAQAREIGEKAKLKLLEEEGIKMVKGGNVIAWKFLMQQQGLVDKKEVTINHTGNVSISPHMQVDPSIRYTRLQKIKELHQRVTLEMTADKSDEGDYDAIFDDD